MFNVKYAARLTQIVDTYDMTIGIEEQLLRVPLVFRFNHFRGKKNFLMIFSLKKPQSKELTSDKNWIRCLKCHQKATFHTLSLYVSIHQYA
jgi:hypothetical protein